MQNNIKLYRKRFIPNEIIHLKDDEILLYNEDLIITKWRTLKPRPDTARGISAYFINQGFKVSKIFDKDNQVVYWYCDIIQTKKDIENRSIIFEDLLVDVVIYENGVTKVLDTGELADAFEQHLIERSSVIRALHILNNLLDIIYSGNFNQLQKYINDME